MRHLLRLGRFVLLAFGAAVSLFLLYGIALFVWAGLFWTADTAPSDRVEMPSPVALVRVTLERRAAHAFLAEYHRALVLVRDGAEIGRAEIPMDTGGTVRVDVYQLSEDTLLLVDQFNSYELDLRGGRITQDSGLHDGRPLGQFIGAFDSTGEGSAKRFRFLPPPERQEKPVPVTRPG